MSRHNPNKVKILHKVLRVDSENQYGDGIQLTYLPEPFSKGSPSSVKGKIFSGIHHAPPSVGKWPTKPNKMRFLPQGSSGTIILQDGVTAGWIFEDRILQGEVGDYL